MGDKTHSDCQEVSVTRSICAVFLLALAYPAVAQVNPEFADVSDEIEMVRSLVRIERKAVVEQAMQLAPAESQAFWTLYNEYEAERTVINDRTVKVITDYAAPSRRRRRARRLCSPKPSTSTQTSSASKEVRDALKKILSPSRVARFPDRAQADACRTEYRRADPLIDQ
jgi:hypothetical protein